jgi:glycosyltransferase involved in cell wall biosynthesis
MINARIPVLQLIDGFATEEQSGGAAQFGIQLARHLDRTRYQPFVCGLWRYNTPSERRWREQLRDEGIETAVLVEQPSSLVPDFMRAAALLNLLLDRIQPCIINSHFERGDVLGLWCKLVHTMHPRIVRTMHTDQQWQTRPWLGRLLNLVAFPWFFDAEVAISEATRQVMDTRLGARLARRQAVLLYNGISSSLLHDQPPISARASGLSPRIAIIGRLERQKGHEYFLQAGALMLQQVPDAELWIVGTGSRLAELQAMATSLGIAHAVRFLGQRTDVPALLASVDLMVSSSIWEGFPTVILEAMAVGVPVVATNVSGSRELIQNEANGVLVPAGNVEHLAEAMLRLLRDREGALRLAAQARQVAQRYTIEATADGYDQLYRAMLRSPRGLNAD